MNAIKIRIWSRLFAVSIVANSALAATIETVIVANPGNLGDTRYPDLKNQVSSFGAVGYTYAIGKHEVTAGQYCEFLNAVARTDTYGLYNPYMDTADPAGIAIFGCNIKRTGADGNYSYTVESDWANRPVNFVSWGDAARFANWMHNGQPIGLQDASTTENGSYSLNGATTQSDLLAVKRNANATWVIPTEDEWYKAAYHMNDGITGNYYDYPTSSDILPSNTLGEPNDPGNNATYLCLDGNQLVWTIGIPYYRTEAGAHENSRSPYGTFDQGGNVWEWNETAVLDSYYGLRGGSVSGLGSSLRASLRNRCDPTYGFEYHGFRLGLVPEPTSLVLLSLGTLAVLGLRRRTAR